MPSIVEILEQTESVYDGHNIIDNTLSGVMYLDVSDVPPPPKKKV